MSTAAQVLRQADALKATVSDNSKNVSEVCVSRQRLEDLYRKVLLMDLEYALDKKVEQELWNHAFKNQINTLQAQAKDKQNPKRAEIQASLDLFLEMASGVYLQLLQLVCSTFKLDLPFRRKSSTYGIMKERTLGKMKINPPKKSSCLYICQYCLVHLGDIARYRQQVDQAQSYYWHAAHLIPVNGQPYNQLAILEVARGNKLSTIFYYIRSLAVRHPFPATATNLEKFFVKISKERSEFRSKLSMSEFLSAFLQFHAFIHLCVELKRAADLSEKLLASMPAHVTSQSFSWHVLVQMLAINLFAMYHASRRTDGSPDSSPDKKEALSEDEERSHDIVFNFTVNSLEILVMYTPKQEQKARSFFTMPAINIITSWLKLDKENYSKPVVKQSSLWPHLAKLFNIIQSATVPVMLDSEGNKKPDSEVALPEDFELRSFQPIEKAHSGLSFSQSILEDRSPELLASIRCQRLVNHGKWIAEQFPSLNLLNVKEEKPGKVFFSSATPLVKVVPVTTDSMNPSEKKTVRQNVAIQAIIQKQKGSEISPERSPANEISPQAKVSKEVRGDNKSDGHSPTKYLLGTPMKDPQFMKASSLRSSGSSPAAAAAAVSTTTNRSPTVTFQLPPQQLSPNQKQSSEKAGIKANHSYQTRHIQSNPPLGAQYRQMQHQQAMKHQKLQQQHHQIKQQLQQQQQHQQWHGSSNSSSSYGSPEQRAELTDLPPPGLSSQSGVGQAGHPQPVLPQAVLPQAVLSQQGLTQQGPVLPQQGPVLPQQGPVLPQQGPSNLALTQRQIMMQQFEALQKMGASVTSLNAGPRQQGLPPDRPSSHAAMIASQQQLLSAMATLQQQQQQQQQHQQHQQQQHQQQQKQQQHQHQNPQQNIPSPMGMTPQQVLALSQMVPRSQHPTMGPHQSQIPNPGHPLQRPPGNVPRQQQSGQPPFPGPMFMHQQFQPARQPHPGLQYGAQSGPQVPTTFNRTQSDQRQIPGKFPQEPISPGIFPHPYSSMTRPNYQFGFTQPNQHPPSPHPIGTPPGGAGHLRDERDLLAGIPQLTIQPPRTLTQGPPPPVRLNNQLEQNSEPILITPDSPQAGDGPRTLYKAVETKGESKPGESTQSGTYSLFSTSPWSVQISSAGDSKSLGSSPFSSQASSIRNSPDPGAELLAGEAGLMTGEAGFNLGLGFGTGDWGVQAPESHSQVTNPNLQVHSLWSSPGPSPLQRLLEQQRQHRQNDPH